MAENSPPKRPPGEPKPLLEEEIAPVLARLDEWYAAHLPPDRYVFNPPATEALDAFERLIGLKLPRAYRQLYRWHDGENDDRWGHIYGLPLLPLHQAGSQWKTWTDVLADFGGNRYEIPGGAWPEGAVDPAYINPRWIPLTHDGSGNHIGLDFDPWPRGRVGQVILFGRDEDVKAVLAESLGKFLEWIAGLLEGSSFRLGAEAEELVLRQFRLKITLITRLPRRRANPSGRTWPLSLTADKQFPLSAIGERRPQEWQLGVIGLNRSRGSVGRRAGGALR